MPWKPHVPGEVPTLGFAAIDWAESELASPDGSGDPLRLTPEEARFILHWYEVDPATGRRLRYTRALLGRPRGWGKSPFASVLCAVEALAPIVPDGWDADGQPVGRPWSDTTVPQLQVAAVSEDQADATMWDPLIEILSSGPVVDDYPGLEPMGGFINLPKGKIRRLTASAPAARGVPCVFGVLDQTESWTRGNGGVKLAQTIRANAAKRRGRTLETPNAPTAGDGSVAEKTLDTMQKILSGKVRRPTVLVDFRSAPPDTDMSDHDSLLKGLKAAYGDAVYDPQTGRGWVDLERLVTEIWQPDTDVELARRDYLNQVTSESTAWIQRTEWESRSAMVLRRAGRQVDDPQPGDEITLGFDGSRHRRRGVTDATALVACRVRDGFVWPIHVWEQPDMPGSEAWEVPVSEVDATVRETFRTYRVAGFFADPAKWESYVAQWEAEFGAGLRVKSTRQKPIEWWMVGGRRATVSRALELFRTAVLNGELVHSGSPTLTRHVVNARKRRNPAGYGIFKPSPDSPRKIDAAVAAVLAWQARTEALSQPAAPEAFVPFRIR